MKTLVFEFHIKVSNKLAKTIEEKGLRLEDRVNNAICIGNSKAKLVRGYILNETN